LSGGVFKCDGCTMNIHNVVMEYNLASKGGVFYVDNSAKINITNATI